MSGARPDTWMPIYIGDYLADTTHLTAEKHGAYLLLIMGCWKRGGKLPNDERKLAQIAAMPLSRWRIIRCDIMPFFMIADAFLMHKRVSQELDKAERLSARNKKNGPLGGRPPSVTKETQTEPRDAIEGSPIGTQSETQTKPRARVPPSPSPSFLPTVGKNSEAIASAALPRSAIDLKREVWGIGKRLLACHGISEKQAGTLIGMWRKDLKDNDYILIDAFAAAESEAVQGDIVAYLQGCVNARKINGHGTQSTGGPATGIFGGAAIALARRAERARDSLADIDPAQPLLDG